MNLQNTQKIKNIQDMTPYTHVVMTFIEVNNLPSFSYPEVYERFVTQLNLPIEEFEGELFFAFPDNFTGYFDLVDAIKELNDNDALFFQRKSEGLSEAGRDVRAAEHLVATTEQVLVEAQTTLREANLRLVHAKVASEAVVI